MSVCRCSREESRPLRDRRDRAAPADSPHQDDDQKSGPGANLVELVDMTVVKPSQAAEARQGLPGPAGSLWRWFVGARATPVLDVGSSGRGDLPLFSRDVPLTPLVRPQETCWRRVHPGSRSRHLSRSAVLPQPFLVIQGLRAEAPKRRLALSSGTGYGPCNSRASCRDRWEEQGCRTCSLPSPMVRSTGREGP